MTEKEEKKEKSIVDELSIKTLESDTERNRQFKTDSLDKASENEKSDTSLHSTELIESKKESTVDEQPTEDETDTGGNTQVKKIGKVCENESSDTSYHLEEPESESITDGQVKDHNFAVPALPDINKGTKETNSHNKDGQNEYVKFEKDSQKVFEKDSQKVFEGTVSANKITKTIDKKSTKKNIDFPHQQPSWGGVPSSENDIYSLTVLKEGIVRNTVNLSGKSKVTFGRLPEACDVLIEHPSCSRFHAVLQYCVEEKDIRKVGYYIYDLGSTHGTYVNKERVKPKVYVRVRVGYQIKFGGSSRLYIMEGPNEDQEEELDMVEVKKIKEHNKQLRATKEKLKQTATNESNDGASWGFQEDAQEEELDLQTLLEKKKKIEVKDPKKTLKGFFDREGIDFEYEMSERGFGNKIVHVAQVRLPIESSYGVEMIAEGTSSNKKDAVLNCATDACRIIQAYDMMQNKCSEDQRLKRQRELEENDFYDSDDDNFLDRTGSVEKKRLKRKQLAGKAEKQEVETHDSLKMKLEEKKIDLNKLELKLKKSIEATLNDEDGDSLDAFMSNMGNKLDKKAESQLKRHIKELSVEIEELERLVDLTQPALPALKLEKKIEKTAPVIREVQQNYEKTQQVERVSFVKDKKVKENKDNLDKSSNKIDTPGDINEKKSSQPPVKKMKVYGVSLPPTLQKNEKKKDGNEKEFVEWMPPENQSGDGRTHLNDKLGY